MIFANAMRCNASDRQTASNAPPPAPAPSHSTVSCGKSNHFSGGGLVQSLRFLDRSFLYQLHSDASDGPDGRSRYAVVSSLSHSHATDATRFVRFRFASAGSDEQRASTHSLTQRYHVASYRWIVRKLVRFRYALTIPRRRRKRRASWRRQRREQKVYRDDI